ncbi:RNB domain-containing protein [Mycena chlorophos]|uniref:RNB domain-containing protein n=1 Tax=Mycena chlorophos TaxID=658473 RepID=A0A8H6TFH9_MYCCL|nr:RNB domain-containing protein [Mycena chlorophos]
MLRRCCRVPLRRHNYSTRPKALSGKERAALKEITDDLVNTAALYEPPPGWSTIQKQGTRLGNLIKSHSGRMPSIHKQAFDAEEGDLDDFETDPFLPGTFVEVRRNNQVTYGVVLGETRIESTVRVATMVTTGEVWDPLRTDVMFQMPGMVPRDLVERCGMVAIARDDKELAARVKVLQRTRELERELDEARKQSVHNHVDVYSMVKAKNPEAWSTTTMPEVARLLSPTPSLFRTFEAHLYLIEQPLHFQLTEGYFINKTVLVRPQSHIDNMQKITEWRRMKNGPIQRFAERALPVIEANKRIREESWDEPPSARRANHQWTTEDREILKFLHHSVQPKRSVQRDPYAHGRTAILRALYPLALITDEMVHRVLVDVGMYAPWQDLTILRNSLNTQLGHNKSKHDSQAVEAVVSRSLAAPARSGPLGPEDLYRTDPLDSIRHDFGDMPVYVIDDSHAQELDDGVSVEPVFGEPDSYWLHVHIADPASTLPPTHILSRLAGEQGETFYLAHKSFPLLPKSLMYSPDLMGFSLTPGRDNRVMTFSSKIDANGELVESVVRAGIARNVIRYTYDQVDMALTGAITPRSYPLSPPPPPIQYAPLPEKHLADLKSLTTIGRRLVDRRYRMGVFETNNPMADITHLAIPPNLDKPSTNPTHFRGFPSFVYSVRLREHTSVSQSIVAEAMKVACRTASTWCLARGVDVIRRAGEPPRLSAAMLEKALALRDKNCALDMELAYSLLMAQPAAKHTLAPHAHWSMGVLEGEGYARVTSPLRRFGDLLAHYQIHRALLGQKQVFSREQVQAYKVRTVTTSKVYAKAQTSHMLFWALMGLERFWARPRADVPNPFEGLYATTMQSSPKVNEAFGELQAPVIIPRLGIFATLADVTRDMDANWVTGGRILVDIKSIELGVAPKLVVTPKSTVITPYGMS